MKKTFYAYIGVGSNINPEESIENALSLLVKHVELVNISSFYWTKPLLNKSQDDYLNGALRIKTVFSPKKLKFSLLKKIETKLGRKKSIDKYLSRIIDFDLILYDDLVINKNDFIIPDSDIYTRAFIAIPLLELNPDLVLPDTGQSIKKIVKKFKMNGMIVNLNFSNNMKKKFVG